MRGRWLGWTALAVLCVLLVPLARHRSADAAILGRYSVSYFAVLCAWLLAIAGVAVLSAGGERRYRAVFNANLVALAIGLAGALAVAELAARRVVRDRFQHYPKGIVARTRTAEYDVEIATNASGFRDDVRGRDHTAAKPAGVARVAVLGDSFVWGSGVAFGHVFAARFAAALDGESIEGAGRASGPAAGRSDSAEALNFGVAGTGPLHHLALYRGAVRRMRPDVVIVTFYAGNDLSDAAREQRERHPRCALLALLGEVASRGGARSRAPTGGAAGGAGGAGGGRAEGEGGGAGGGGEGWNALGGENPATLENLLREGRRRGVPPDTIRARLAAIPESLVAAARAFRSNPYNLAGAVLDPESIRENVLFGGPAMEDAWRAAESALGALHREIERDGARMLLVAIPAGAQVDSAYWGGAARLGYRFDERMTREAPVEERLERFASARAIAYVDLLPAFRAHRGEPLYFALDGHWNEAGHALAAATIAPRLAALLAGGR